MNKAKLIKRKDWLEQEKERIARQQARRSHASQVRGDTVRNWVKRAQATRKPEPRQLFAALFVYPAAC